MEKVKQLLNKKFLLNVVVFFVCLLVAYFFTYENITSEWFDWLNYHHYNAWAFLNDRLSVDFFAANSRTYFCPYVEVFNFVTLNLFKNNLDLFVLVNCFDSAIFLFLAFKICEYFYSYLPNYKNWFALLSIAFFVFCVPEFREAQDFSHAELFVSNIIMIALLICVPALFEDKTKAVLKKICIGGCLLGVAIGFKLVSIIFVLGLVVTVLLLQKRISDKWVKLLWLLVPCFVVFFVMDFYWLCKVYSHFKNPFFPYFNSIFHSEFIEQSSFMKSDFGHLYPKNLFQFLFFPLLYFNHNRMFGYDRCIVTYIPFFSLVFSIILFNFYSMVNADNRKKDKFVFVIYLVMVVLIPFCFSIHFELDIYFYFLFASVFIILSLCILRVKEEIYDIFVNKINLVLFVLGFYFVTYYLNLLIFACNRYIMLLSVFAYLILVLVTLITSKYIKLNAVCLLIINLILFGCINRYDYKDYDLLSGGYTTVIAPDFKYKDGSTVLVGSYLVSAVIPYQNKNVSYRLFANPCKPEELALDDNISLYEDMFSTVSTYSKNEIKKILQDKNKKVYILYVLDKNGYYKKFLLPGLKKYNTKREAQNCKSEYIYFFDKQYEITSCELNYVGK